MQESIEKAFGTCKAIISAILPCTYIILALSGIWIFLYSIFIAKGVTLFSLVPQTLIYLFLFISLTVGLFPALTFGIFYITKSHFKELFKNKKPQIPSLKKRLIIPITLISCLLGIIPLLLVYKNPKHQVAAMLIILIPSTLTAISGYLYIRDFLKKQKKENEHPKGLLITMILWFSILLPFSLIFPALISTLFLTKTASKFQDVSIMIWLYLILLILIYFLPFFSPAILPLIIKEALQENHERTKQIKSILIGAIILLIMALPVWKWILVSPLTIAKIGYFEAQIFNKKTNQTSEPILIIWKAGNRIIYTELPKKLKIKESKNKRGDELQRVLRERELSADEELIYLDKSVLELPPP